MSVDLIIPRETVNDETVTIVLLLVPHGHKVREGESLAEIETSKANVSVEASESGYVEWYCNNGDRVDATACIGRIHPQASDVASKTERKVVQDATELAGAELSVIRETTSNLSVDSGLIEGSYPLFSDAANWADRQAGNRQISGDGSVLDLMNSKSKKQDVEITPPTPPLPSIAANLRHDLFRYGGRTGWKGFLSTLWYEPGFRATLIYRLGYFANRDGRRFRLPFLILAQRLVCLFHGISLPFETTIGPGLCFPHCGGIWVNSRAVLGANVTLGHEVSIGSAGPKPLGHPVIGDRCYLSPGAKITGPIRIGADVLVTANALVSIDSSDGSILVGVPASVQGCQKTNKFITSVLCDTARGEGND